MSDTEGTGAWPHGPIPVRTEMVNGHPLRTYASGPHTLVEVLEHARAYGTATCLVHEDERYSFADQVDTAAALAEVLMTDFGIRTGDRVALAMRNYPEFLFFFWAAQVLGAIAVPLNAWWTRDELARAVADCDPRLVVVDPERWERLSPVLAHRQDTAVVMVRGDDGMTPGGPVPYASIRRRLRQGLSLPDTGVTPDLPSTILYTSGTTGTAKGAVFTHRNHCVNLLNAMSAAAGRVAPASGPQRAQLMPLPLFHISGLSIAYVAFASGTKLVMPRKWDAERAVQLIEAESVTQFTGVVAMAGPFLDVCEAAGAQLPTLTAVMFGASSVPPDLVARVARVFAGRVPMGTGYGMTETTSSFARISGQEYLDHPDSVGRPFPVYDVKIVDEHGGEVATGTAGELWVRGPSVVPGYWRDPEATAAAFTDGWHHTGDIARLDDTGRIYPVDRKKDIIIRGGENVYCVEVEAAIHAHPDVAAVAVVGRPAPDLGEEVVAVVRRRPGAGVTAEQLREHAAARLAYFKVPTAFVFADRDFPRTATGKILKRQLADEVRAAGR